MPERRLTRANTTPGSVERKAVYAREYQERQARAQQISVSYTQARQLRQLWPMSAQSKAELRKNHRNMGQAHTRYAVIRSQIAIAEANAGNKVSARQRRSIRVLREPLGTVDPVAELAQWYQYAWGSDYRPQDFGSISLPPTGGGFGGGFDSGGGGDSGGSGDSGGMGGGGSGGTTGAGLAGYEWDHEVEELYDIEWTDLDEWDLWDFGEY